MSLGPTESVREAFGARQATIATALLLMFTDAGFAAIEGVAHGDIHGMYLAHASLAALIALLLSRRMVSVRWSLLAYATLLLPTMPLLWLIDAKAIAAGAPWPLFTGGKLIVLGVLLLTPSAALAAALLVAFVAEWLLFCNRFELWAHPGSGEPWVTMLYFIAAFLVVWLGWHNRRLERVLCGREVETQTRREVGQVAAAVRDQVSTPLQNLELSIAELRTRHPEELRTLERMERAVERLTELRPLQNRDQETARVRALRLAGERLD